MTNTTELGAVMPAGGVNEMCSLQAVCERQCSYHGRETDCPFYAANVPGTASEQEDGAGTTTAEAPQETTAKIRYINTAYLFPHPQNPRTSLGDLTELADSIRVNGILQNLTIVPATLVPAVMDRLNALPEDQIPGEAYVVVIGHRRLAAAVQAGLTEVPCVLANLNPQEQCRVMLMENIQRQDLTLYEQAQGFQMMLDLGDTVDSLAERSGFSKTTIRRRLDLLKFDGDTFQAAVGKQITLDVLSDVGKITDPEKRNRVLSEYGTSNFSWSLKSALDAETAKKNAPLVKEEILKYAESVKEDDINYAIHNRLLYVSYTTWHPGEATPEELDPGAKYKVVFYSGSATVYLEKSVSKEIDAAKTAAEKAAEKKKKAIQKRIAELQEVSNRAAALRREFALGIKVTNKDWMTLLNEVSKATATSKILYTGNRFADTYSDLMGETMPDTYSPQYGADRVRKSISGVKSCVATILAAYGDTRDSQGNSTLYYWGGHFNAMPEHAANMLLDYVYEFLSKFGYEMSDEEKQLQDGTHHLFAVEDEKKKAAPGDKATKDGKRKKEKK